LKRLLSQFTFFVLIFFVLNSGIAHYLSKDLTHNKRSKYHWVCGLNGEHYDVAYVGSSRVEMTVDPHVIDASLGTASINTGVSGGGAGDQFLLTSHLLQQNKVQSVLFQVDYLSLADKFAYPFKDYIWLCYGDNTDVEQAMIDHRGHFRIYVRKTIELCQQNGIQPILFQAPYRSSLSEVSEFPECSQLIQQLADEYDLDYWDFSDLYTNQPELFYDNHHLNSEGVKRFSQLLAQRIKDANVVRIPENESISQ
jgi:hypothetical protein